MTHNCFRIKRRQQIHIANVCERGLFGDSLMEVAMHSFDVRVVFASAEDIEASVAAGSAEYGGCCVNAASLWSTGHPVYTFNYHFDFTL